MEYVNVVFKNGKKGTIMVSEYEANKDKGYIQGLDNGELELIDESSEEVNEKPAPSQNKIDKRRKQNK